MKKNERKAAFSICATDRAQGHKIGNILHYRNAGLGKTLKKSIFVLVKIAISREIKLFK